MRRWLVVLLMAVLLGAGARADVAVTLKAVARIDAGAGLTVGDVASVSGDASVHSIPVAAATGDPGRMIVGVDDVRRALAAHGYGRADVTVRGQTCTVVVREKRAAGESGPIEPVTEPVEPLTNGTTVRDHVRAAIERVLGVSGGSLRLAFLEDDAATLGRATAGLTVDVHATGLGRRTPVRVTLYGADGSIEVLRVRVGVQLLREVARANRALPRGTALSAGDLSVSREWLAPDEPHVEPVKAIGQRLRRGVDMGERLTDGSVEPPVVIERGDIVMVHVVSGTVVLRQESRALETGRVGQRIRLEPMSGGREFRAVVEAPGRAVIVTRGMSSETGEEGA